MGKRPDLMKLYGFRTLLTDGDNNFKTAKSNKASNYHTMIMHLAPQKESGYGNVCVSASPGCIAACLYHAGRGAMSNVIRARVNRTKLWFRDRDSFLVILVQEVDKLVRKCDKLGKLPALRLNGTSDINWLKTGIFQEFKGIQFYDYTKVFSRFQYQLPHNYTLLFSMSETEQSQKQAQTLLNRGHNT